LLFPLQGFTLSRQVTVFPARSLVNLAPRNIMIEPEAGEGTITQPANSAIKLDNVTLAPAPSAPAVGLAALLLAARRRRGR
jgi:MYXO-CTERM domain-containing protein